MEQEHLMGFDAVGDHRIGGVDLQGQVGDILQTCYGIGEHCYLVNFGKSYVDVENVYPCLGLRESLAQNVVHIVGKEGFFELLFARGVDALTNENGSFIDEIRFPRGYGLSYS